MARPRGYADWNPKAETLDLIDAVQVVLDEYRDHLPLTVRQIFYRLVGSIDYEKTERAYARLCEHLVRARRAQIIPFDAIRDDGTVVRGGGGYDDAPAFWRAVKSSGKHFMRDRMQEQPVAVELWCEAAGMVPQLARVAAPFTIPVYSTGGFSSVTVTYEIAQRCLTRDVPTVMLHVGDYDPSGESIFHAISTDARSFLFQETLWKVADEQGSDERDRVCEHFANERCWPDDVSLPDLYPVRVALTEDQVIEHDLPTAPPKRSDTRSRNWDGDTCQAEAMPPDLLADTVRDAIWEHVDRDIYDRQCAAEDEDRDAILKTIEAAL